MKPKPGFESRPQLSIKISESELNELLEHLTFLNKNMNYNYRMGSYFHLLIKDHINRFATLHLNELCVGGLILKLIISFVLRG